MAVERVQDAQKGLQALADLTRRAQKGETKPKRVREAEAKRPQRGKLRADTQRPQRREGNERVERRERPRIQSRRESTGQRVDTRA